MLNGSSASHSFAFGTDRALICQVHRAGFGAVPHIVPRKPATTGRGVVVPIRGAAGFIRTAIMRNTACRQFGGRATIDARLDGLEKSARRARASKGQRSEKKCSQEGKHRSFEQVRFHCLVVLVCLLIEAFDSLQHVQHRVPAKPSNIPLHRPSSKPCSGPTTVGKFQERVPCPHHPICFDFKFSLKWQHYEVHLSRILKTEMVAQWFHRFVWISFRNCFPASGSMSAAICSW